MDLTPDRIMFDGTDTTRPVSFRELIELSAKIEQRLARYQEAGYEQKARIMRFAATP